MIKKISINNYALIDRSEIEPHQRFTVITGETGAGKSILLGALGMTIGQRADASVLMDSNRKCIIEIIYNIAGYNLNDWFAENDLDYSEEVTVRREITAEGKSRGFINDTPVNNKTLKEFGTFLIDIHSQHQSLLLARPEYQTEILDAFAQNQSVLNKYKQMYTERKTLITQLSELKDEAQRAAQERDYLSFQLSRLDEASLKKGEKESLEEELNILSNAESIKSAYQQITYELRDRDDAVISSLKSLKQHVSNILNVTKNAAEYESRLNSTIIELKDLAEEAERSADNIEYDSRRIEKINTRLSVIYDLLSKYRVKEVNELIDIRKTTASKLVEIQSYEEKIAQLEKKLSATEKELRSLALDIHKTRQKAGDMVCSSVIKLLTELGIHHAQFIIDIQERQDFTSNGMDNVSFLFAANKNQQPGELIKVASGGEISRVMLSLKYMLSKVRKLPIIIFDEIDTGLSGEIAHKMAQMMCEMAQSMQVISISHLPQIAAAGNMHLKVYKEDSTDRTISKIRPLNNDERIREIAGMISGVNITPAALDAAKNLLTGSK